MNYQMFQELLAEEIRQQSGGSLRVFLQKLTKNNGVKIDTLSIQGGEDTLVPSIYMEHFYQQYLRGVSVSHLAKILLAQYQEFRKEKRLPEDFFSSYAQAAPGIFCKAINFEKNRELLETVPHQRWLDLALVYYYQVERHLLEDAAILIRESHLERWHIDERELEIQAWANTIQKLPPSFQKLGQVLREWGELGQIDGRILYENPLYLLTNQTRCLGAVCICYPGETEAIGEFLGRNYYVLPSSIHECLILPDDGRYTWKELRKMVREINETQLQPQEVLSDQVYYYDRSIQRLSLDNCLS